MFLGFGTEGEERMERLRHSCVKFIAAPVKSQAAVTLNLIFILKGW